MLVGARQRKSQLRNAISQGVSNRDQWGTRARCKIEGRNVRFRDTEGDLIPPPFRFPGEQARKDHPERGLYHVSSTSVVTGKRRGKMSREASTSAAGGARGAAVPHRDVLYSIIWLGSVEDFLYVKGGREGNLVGMSQRLKSHGTRTTAHVDGGLAGMVW